MVTETVIATVTSAGLCQPGTVTLDSTFAELGLDSLDATNITYELEKQLNVRLPNEEFVGIAKVADLVERFEKFLPGRLPKPAFRLTEGLPVGISAEG